MVCSKILDYPKKTTRSTSQRCQIAGRTPAHASAGLFPAYSRADYHTSSARPGDDLYLGADAFLERGNM